MNVADIEPGQPVPKETYGTTLSRILNALTEIFAGDELNTTMLVSDSDYDVNFGTLTTLKNLRIYTRDTGEKFTSTTFETEKLRMEQFRRSLVRICDSHWLFLTMILTLSKEIESSF
jgi:hypothetical protein